MPLKAALPALLLLIALSLGVSACGSGDDNGGGGGSLTAADFQPPTAAPSDAKKGGTLTVVSSGDIDFMDPGAAYYQVTYIIDYAWQRALMGWPPDESKEAQPDLADGQPQVTDGGKTVTFKIKKGIRFSPPVNREIKAADFKYAIERGLLPGVATSYVASYFGDVNGYDAAAAAAEKDPTVAPNISGITTPDDHTLVIKSSKPTAPVIIGALSLPLGAPVPEEYAKQFDTESPSAYGDHAVGTGPYMVQNNSSGELTG